MSDISPAAGQRTILPDLAGALPVDIFKKDKLKIGLCRRSPEADDKFFQSIMKVLSETIHCEVLIFPTEKCGPLSLAAPDSGSRKDAINIFREAEKNEVDVLIPESIDCYSFLKAINRPDGLEHSSVKIMDIYSFLYDMLEEK